MRYRRTPALQDDAPELIIRVINNRLSDFHVETYTRLSFTLTIAKLNASVFLDCSTIEPVFDAAH